MTSRSPRREAGHGDGGRLHSARAHGRSRIRSGPLLSEETKLLRKSKLEFERLRTELDEDTGVEGSMARRSRLLRSSTPSGGAWLAYTARPENPWRVGGTRPTDRRFRNGTLRVAEGSDAN